MRHFVFLKSIIFMMMVAFVAISANAQRVIENINVRDTTACIAYLSENLGDTIKAVSRYEKNDTVFVKTTRVFVKNNAVVFRTDSDVYVVDPEYLAKKAENAALLDTLYKKSVDALFVEKVKSAGADEKRDTYFSEVGDSLRIPHASADKYGASLEISGGCLFSETVTSPLVSVGFEYSGSWWAGILNAELGWNKYNKNAVNAGSSYLTYSTELLGAVQPFKLNKANTARLFLVGGAGFQWYSTDSKPWMGEDGQWYDFRSGGNSPYWTAGLRFEWRKFATGNSWTVSVLYRQLTGSGVIQNASLERENGVMVKIGYSFGLCRNKMGSVKESKALAY